MCSRNYTSTHLFQVSTAVESGRTWKAGDYVHTHRLWDTLSSRIMFGIPSNIVHADEMRLRVESFRNSLFRIKNF